MKHERALYGALEAGGTKFVCAVATSPDEIIAHAAIPTTSPTETLKALLDFFTSHAHRHGPLEAIGVASFGPIDIDARSSTYGSILATPKAGWTGVNYIDAFAELETPAVVETDVNGACIGEFHGGAGRGCKSLAYVTVGTGIGVGVVTNGLALRGMRHFEMGHIRPPHDWERDPYSGCCPFHSDCLEGLASGPAIIERWGHALNAAPPGHDSIDLEARYLSHLALTIILAHMPERIVFGGGVMKSPGLLEQLRERTRELLASYVDAPNLKGDLDNYIVAPSLGDRSGIAGAIILAQQHAERKRAQ